MSVALRLLFTDCRRIFNRSGNIALVNSGFVCNLVDDVLSLVAVVGYIRLFYF